MIYTVTTTLPLSHGGRTQALLRRIKLLDEEFKIPSKILTTNYHGNYPSIYKKYRQENKVTENIQFENMYEWLSNFKLFKVPKTLITRNPKYIKTPRKIKGLIDRRGKKSGLIHYYNNECHVRSRKYYGQSNVLEYEDFISPTSGLKYERHQYNLYGQLHRKEYYYDDSSLKHSDELFDTEGSMYCKRYFKTKPNSKINGVEIYRNKKLYKTFKNDKLLAQFYFQNRFKNQDIVFNDARFLDKPLLKQTHQTKNILVLHSSHLSGDQIKKSYRFALNQSKNVYKYIVLTHQQKHDIQQHLPISDDQFQLVPHFIELDTEVEQDSSNNQNRFIYIGRFSAEKQIDHIIRAYHKFLQSGYQTELHLFGRDEDNQIPLMNTLISELKLSDKVKIFKYTNQPLQEFKNSKASLLTSQYEGFGLTLMESIEMGCPVLSYNVRYGPSEIIQNGINGYLIEKNDIDSLSKHMINIIEHPLQEVKNKDTLKYNAAVNNYKQLMQSLDLLK